MASLIHRLQADALTGQVEIGDLLRKAYVAATKLDVPDMLTWLRQEMRGYECRGDEIPEYRHVKGHLIAFNPYRG